MCVRYIRHQLAVSFFKGAAEQQSKAKTIETKPKVEAQVAEQPKTEQATESSQTAVAENSHDEPSESAVATESSEPAAASEVCDICYGYHFLYTYCCTSIISKNKGRALLFSVCCWLIIFFPTTSSRPLNNRVRRMVMIP
jgi:hypothetical protein